MDETETAPDATTEAPAPRQPGDDAGPSGASAAPDPGLLALALRRHDLADAPGEDRELAAYQPFAPGLWCGFQPGAQAWIRAGRDASGEAGVILTLEPGPSSWLSLEMELDMAALADTEAALLSLEAAANPTSGLRIVLRMPCAAAENGFWDSRAQSMALTAEPARRSLAFFPQMDRLQPHDGFPRAVLIAFLPLRRTELFLSSITFGPAA